MNAESKPKHEFLRHLFFFLGLFFIVNFDRFVFGEHSLVREHDWYDHLAHTWKACYQISDIFNFFTFNKTMLGGYDCHVQGIVPFSPLAILYAYLPQYLIYAINMFLIFFSCFLGITCFARAINLRLPPAMIGFFAYAHGSMVIREWITFYLDPSALILYAWLIRGRELAPSKWVRVGLLGLLSLRLLSMPLTFLVPFFVVTSFFIALIFRRFIPDGLKGFATRFIAFWGIVAVAFAPTTILQLKLAPEMMRREMINWLPVTSQDIVNEFRAGIPNDFFIPFCTLLIAATSLLVSRSLPDRNDRQRIKDVVRLASLMAIIVVFSRYVFPMIDFATKAWIPKPFILTNQWVRFYLTIQGLGVVLSLAILALVHEGLKRSRIKQLMWIALLGFVVWQFWAFPYGRRVEKGLTYSVLAIAISYSFWIRFPVLRKYLTAVMTVAVVIYSFHERRLYSTHFEYRTHAQSAIPAARKLASELDPETISGYRAITVAFHPTMGIEAGFTMADGYLTLYPMTYKRIWAKAARPAVTNPDGSLMNYFKHWAGRVYVFLPGAAEGQFPIKCPEGPIGLETLIDIPQMKDLGVRWILSRCELESPILKRLHHFPGHDAGHPFRKLRNTLFLTELPDVPNSIAYEIEDPKPIIEVVDQNKIWMRYNVCHKLRKFGFENSTERFGFVLRKDAPEDVLTAAKDCYPGLARHLD